MGSSAELAPCHPSGTNNVDLALFYFIFFPKFCPSLVHTNRTWYVSVWSTLYMALKYNFVREVTCCTETTEEFIILILFRYVSVICQFFRSLAVCEVTVGQLKLWILQIMQSLELSYLRLC